ncbi:MAG: hypothetical protein IKF90_10465 [Parasporobacterium sp.]|nr:hypothetical protein [Parasporobacterium sp.]
MNEWKKQLEERDNNIRWINHRLFELDRSMLYLGDEMNTFHFDWDAAIEKGTIDEFPRILLMNLNCTGKTLDAPALLMFYDELHTLKPFWIVERSLCPATSNDTSIMKQDGIRPFAVESKMSAECFDVICMSMDVYLNTVSIPWYLYESGIPLFSKERSEEDPFIVLGGAALYNPAPLMNFCDIFFFGEGEDLLPDLLEMIVENKHLGLSREDILLKAAKAWDCLYVPRFYEERFSESGTYEGTFPTRPDVPSQITFYRVKDLDKSFVCTKPPFSFGSQITSNSFQEISKSCEGKCSFCTPCFISLPFRARSAELVRKYRREAAYSTGNFSSLLVSFNSASHPEINRIVHEAKEDSCSAVVPLTFRADTCETNPEYFCFVASSENSRAALGIEGASQRLRDLVSKNLSEEQILNTMREICHFGVRFVKLMMINNLPGETQEDLNELVELVRKIMAIFEKETLPGLSRPKLLISWTPLVVYPHSPLQWTRINRHLHADYSSLTKRLKELGCLAHDTDITSDSLVHQLILRSDSRLEGFLLQLAKKGLIRHKEPYPDEVLNSLERYLSENDLPSLDEWFREYSYEDPLPWDLIKSPASKQYLWKRFQMMKPDCPENDTVCTRACSGCGGCGPEEKLRMKEIAGLRKQDANIKLGHVTPKERHIPKQHVLMKFEYDLAHSFVFSSYWDCEIRRALNLAGIKYDPESICTPGSGHHSGFSGAGLNLTCIALDERIELTELKDRIQEHAFNFHITSLTEIESPLRITSVSYFYKLPFGTDESSLSEIVKEKLSQKEWVLSFQAANRLSVRKTDFRPFVTDAFVKDGCLYFTSNNPDLDPRRLVCCLMDLPLTSKLPSLPVRTEFEFEKKGILDLAIKKETREAFIKKRSEMIKYDEASFNALSSYISSTGCVWDLMKLVSRDYFISPPYHFLVPKDFSGRKRDIYTWRDTTKFLLSLICFALRDYDHFYSDGLYSFRMKKNAKDFLLRLKNEPDISRYYIVKADISNYANSIVPELILPSLKKIWSDDPSFYDLLEFLLLRRECIEKDGQVVSCEPGGLGGIPLSNHFMNVYLMELDEHFEGRVPLYCRYSDDIIIFARTRKEAEEHLAYYYQLLKKKKLTTNPDKTFLIEPGGEVDILGFRLKDGKMDVSDHAKSKLKRKIRLQANNLIRRKKKKGIFDYDAGRMMIEYCNKIFFGQSKTHKLTWSRWLFPVISDTSSLQELDHYIQDAVRYVICGSLAKKRYRIRYEDLKRLGYRSLVHAYYHFKT